MNKARFFFRTNDIATKYLRNYRRYKNVTVIKDMPYSDINEKYNKADILFDANQNSGKYPVLVNVHGGGFVAGDKSLRTSLCKFYANDGWFVFNINYRLHHEFAAPNATIDVINALNFLPSLEKQYNLDLNKIVLAGDSAGGYLAAHAMASIASEEVREVLDIPECKVKIRAIMLTCGIFDLENILERKAPFGIINVLGQSILGFDITNKENLQNCTYLKQLSPIHYVNSDWAEAYVSMAKKDVFCGGQGELMVDKLEKHGIKTTAYYAYEMGEIHCSHLFMYKKSSKLWNDSALEFLKTIK